MSKNLVPVTITLVDPESNEEELQEAVSNLRFELLEMEGVEDVTPIPVEVAPIRSKSLGGFVLGSLKAIVDLKNIKVLTQVLGNHLYGKTIEIKAEGNGRKLEVKLSRADDLAKIIPEINKFIDG